jgi:hypothetical protein
VLFGGAAGAPLADTWEWDGTSWSLQAPTASPPARSFHAMAFDGSRSVVTMTGGSHQILVNGSVVNVELPLELWDWNGSNWQNLPIAAAPTRRMHAMAFDGARGRLVVQGGLEPEGIVSTTQSRMVPSSDTFEFVRNGATVYSQGGACPFSGPRLRAESLPFTGNPSFALQLALADASLPAMLGFATTPAFSPLTFANGCRLHLGVPTFTSSLQVTNPGGAARWALAVAANPALRGIQLWAQGAVLDLALQPRTTDFLLLTIGE